MNSHHQPSFLRRRMLALAACAALAGGTTTWLLAESKDQAKPTVTVKVDAAPLQRTSDSVSYSPIVKRVAPAVVKVVTRERAKEMEMGGAGGASPFDDPRFREFFGLPPGGTSRDRRMQRQPQPQQPQQIGLGSGVIVSPDGYILTNNHVVSGADTVKVTLADGRELNAKVVGTDEKTDVAVIKVDAKNLSAVTFADSDDVQVGDRVLAVGNPFGLGQTVTTGIVSATGRAVSLGVDYADFIQTDAAINPGNSGGALIDMQGRLIGINTAILSRTGGFQGIGFAIPARLARHVMDSIVQEGKVVRGFLGVTIQDVTPALAESFNLKTNQGALISDVSEDGPAAKAGLKSGDVVLELNGKAVADSQRLRFAVAEVRPGTDANVKILREGKEQTIKVQVGDQPGENRLAKKGASPDKDEGSLNGVGVSDLTPAARNEFDIPGNVRGALVTQVDPNSPSAVAGLSPGDVIQEINGKPVRNSEEAVHLTEKTETGKTRLKLWSRGGTHYLVVDETEGAASTKR